MSRSGGAEKHAETAIAHRGGRSLPARNTPALARCIPFGCRVAAGVGEEQCGGDLARRHAFVERVEQPEPLDQTPVLGGPGHALRRRAAPAEVKKRAVQRQDHRCTQFGLRVGRRQKGETLIGFATADQQPVATTVRVQHDVPVAMEEQFGSDFEAVDDFSEA